MAAKEFLIWAGNTWKSVLGLQVSSGSADGGKIVALDDTGRLSPTMMPVGIGADTASLIATEAISAGRYVSMYNVAGVASVRLADASVSGKPADGFVLDAVSSGAMALVYKEGNNTQLTGLTPATDLYLSATTPGGVTETAPTTAGYIVQRVGKSISVTSADFERGIPIILGQLQ